GRDLFEPHVKTVAAAFVALALTHRAVGAESDLRGRQFIGFDSFSAFAESPGPITDQSVLTSPVVPSVTNFNEVIVSWNADLRNDSYLKVELRVANSNMTTKYYNMGFWSKNPQRHPRQSQTGQKDADGDVSTDTLILNRPANRLQVRITLG